MAIETRYTSFNLHEVGKSANDRMRDQAVIRRGNAASGGAVFTDPNRDFTADGITTSHKIQILEGGGNIQREVLITVVGTTTVTVAGGNFDTTENNLRYRVFLPPTDTEIVDDPKKRGRGLVGWQEILTKIEVGMLANFLSQTADVGHSEGLTQQSITYDPQFVPWAADLGQNAVQIVDVASALLLSPITSWISLTDPGVTPWVSAENFHHNTFIYVVSGINTNVTVRAEGSPDEGTTIYHMDDDEQDETKNLNGAYMMHKPNFKAGWVRFNFVGESGGVGAAVTPFLIQGN